MMTEKTVSELIIRRATFDDVPAIGGLGGKLVMQHHDYDARRFTIFEPLEANFAEFIAAQIADENAVVLAAELDKQIVGYAFIRTEADSFLEALTASAWLHDIYIDDAARRKNIGKRLLDAALEAARELGSSSLMLSVSPHNETAQRLFKQYGFRPTMQEMRLDFEPEEQKI